MKRRLLSLFLAIVMVFGTVPTTVFAAGTMDPEAAAETTAPAAEPETTEPTAETAPTEPETTEPTAETAPSEPETTEPTMETTPSEPETTEPTMETTMSEPETTEPTVETTMSEPGTTEPAVETTLPGTSTEGIAAVSAAELTAGQVGFAKASCTVIGSYESCPVYYLDASGNAGATSVVLTDYTADDIMMIAGVKSNAMVMDTNEVPLTTGYSKTKDAIAEDTNWVFDAAHPLSGLGDNLYTYWVSPYEDDDFYIIVNAYKAEAPTPTAPDFTASVNGETIAPEKIEKQEGAYEYTLYEQDEQGNWNPVQRTIDLYVLTVPAGTATVDFTFTNACLAYGYDDDKITCTEGMDEYSGGMVGKTTATRSVDKDGDGNMDYVTVQSPYDANYVSVSFYAISFRYAEAAGPAVTLDKTEAALYPEGTVTLTATVTPENTEDKTVTWTSSDEAVATVADGVVTGVAAGEATITATCGTASAQCTVQVFEKKLASLSAYPSTAAYTDGDAPLTLTPAFDGDVANYQLAMADYLTSLYLVAAIPEDQLAAGLGNDRGSISSAWGSSTAFFKDGAYKGWARYSSSSGCFFLTYGNRYEIKPNYYPTLKSLTVDGVMDKAFDRDTTEYHAYVDGTAEGVVINPAGYKGYYTITVNGTKVDSGKDYTLPYDWDASGKMQVAIELNYEGMTSHTYTVTLEKQPLEDKPFVMTEPTEADYTIIEKDSSVKPLTVIASANGELAYQWYYNSTDSNENGTKIEGATEASYTPPYSEDVIGTRYYYCVITNTGKTEGNVAVSKTARVTVYDDPTPIATLLTTGTELGEAPEGVTYSWHKGYYYNVDDTDVTPLKVSVTSKVPCDEFTYEWSSPRSMYDISAWSGLDNNKTDTYTPGVTLKDATDQGSMYACRVSRTFLGKKYSAWATTGETVTEGEGENVATYDVTAAYVFVKTTGASTPTINSEIQDKTYNIGDRVQYIYPSVSCADGGDLTYQWYVNDERSTEGATPIEGATSWSFLPGESKASEAMVGTKYYFYVVTNSIQGYTASATSNVCAITVKGKGGGDVGGLLKGSGTAEDPYQIFDAQDYQDIYDLVKEGMTFDGSYLKQMNDITLPDPWAPIGTSLNNAFGGDLDGGGWTLTVPEGNPALLAYVKGAKVHDLQIYGKQITSAGLVSNLTGTGVSGEAICIENVTLKSGSSTLGSGLLDSKFSTSGFAACSAGFYATIRNCTVESGVVVGYDKTADHIGSIAGRANAIIENCTSAATVYGTSYVGGILGARDNALGTFKVSGCAFTGSVTATGEYAGGILGGGYNNSSAPNGLRVSVDNCTVSGSVTGKNKVGGILGGDEFVAQSWDSHTVTGNSFTGTVQAAGGTAVGGIIGYYDSLNKLDNISGNYYAASCGAAKGIGEVKYVDTNCAAHETESKTLYFSTETSTDDCPPVAGCSWKTGHNRTDDPLGADAAKLCYTDSTPVTATELKVSGNYKTEYTTGEALDLSGIELTVVYNDDSSKTISLADVTVSGFDPQKVGEQELTLSYEGLTAVITVRVKNPEGQIEVTISLLGDAAHGDNGTVHTYSGGGLSTWVGPTKYKADSNATVWTVLKKLLDEKGYSYRNPSGNYVEAINGLAELSNGANSGWMYTLNGAYPKNGVSQQYLKDGDVIVFHYSDDYTKEGSGSPAEDDNGAEKVDKLIGEIGEVTLTDDCKNKIDAARKAYDALSPADKAKVEKLPVLEAAEADYAKLKEADDGKKAADVESLIDKIDSEITLDSEEAIRDARAAYNKLTADQKKLVKKLNKLTRAERDLAELKATEDDKKKAQDVIDMIDKLGSVTLDSEKDIQEARTAYDKLTDTQKALVTNYEVLEKAEETLAALKDRAIYEDAYKTTGDYLEKLGTPQVGSVGGEWMAIGLARSDREVPEDYYKNAAAYVLQNMDENQRLHNAKSSDNSRLILALTAIGKDVTDVEGHNLLAGLNDMDYIQKQGLNGPIWALLAFDSGNYPTPEGNVTRDALIQVILDAQLQDGGWALSGENSDPDLTGMALQALAPYRETNQNVKSAADKAIAALSRMQNADGGYSSIDGASSESAAQVIVALTALGIDPGTDERFIKNDTSVLDALLEYFVQDGGFKHILTGNRDGMATEQCYYALTAYARFLEGKTSLYNMTDVIDKGGDPADVPPETEPTQTLPPQTVPAETEPAETESGGSPWWIAIVVLVIGGGCAAAAILMPMIRKKG